MTAKLRADRGATLTEQLFALLLGSMMIASLCGFYRSELGHYLALETKTATLEDARGALDIIVNDLKNAGSWNKASPPQEKGGVDDPDHDADTVCNRVYAATATLIHIQMDLNDDGDCVDTRPPENIRYELTGPTATCPGPNIIRRNGDCLVANITIPSGGKLFRYYDAAGAELGDLPDLRTIKRIRIAFTVRVKNPNAKIGGSLTSTVSTGVELRNADGES